MELQKKKPERRTYRFRQRRSRRHEKRRRRRKEIRKKEINLKSKKKRWVVKAGRALRHHI